MNKLIIILGLLLGAMTAKAQFAFNGQHSYDGEHKNAVISTIIGMPA